jgi:excinuclease ABC subunit A
VVDLIPVVEAWPIAESDHATVLLKKEILSRLSYLSRAGLSYLHLDRQTRTLSGGELQRVNLTTCLGASLVNTLFVLDEPSIGLHPRDIGRLIGVMEGLRDKGNTLLVVEHEEAVIRAADHVLEIGPGRGRDGGQLVYSGDLASMEKDAASLTADYLTGRKRIEPPAKRRRTKKTRRISIRGARHNNLQNLDVDFPLDVFCCVTGVSGSGKSTLVHEVLYRNLQRLRGEVTEDEPGRIRSIKGEEKLGQVVLVDQTPLARTPRSTPAVYVGAFDIIRQLFAETEDGRSQGLTPGFFSFNSGQGRCERCMGNGFEKIEMQFLSDLYVTCPECNGTRFQPHALTFKLAGSSIHEVLQFTVDQAVVWFRDLQQQHERDSGRGAKSSARRCREVVTQLELLSESGLGYLTLGQPLTTLSGGEAQRLKLVGHLLSGPPATAGEASLLLLDEPTTGLHFDDIALLVKLLQRLVNEGHSLLVIEHNLEVIQCADWIIDLGPDGGKGGGSLVTVGTPEDVAECRESWTGRYLRARSGPEGAAPSEPVSYRSLSPATTLMAAEEAPSNRSAKNTISIRGAREHNLKNLSLEIPRDEFVVVSGLSGSGKSSLAFDLVFAEGQRRFLDSMSVYARTFVEQMEKPDVDLVSGVPPTVAIEQRISRGGGKSTVATVTEVWHFLRLLFAKLGTQFCPSCNVPVQKQSLSAITETLRKAASKGSYHVMSPLIRARKGFHTEVAEAAQKKGIETLLVDGEFRATEGFQRLARFKEHTIDAVVAEVGRKTKTGELREIVEEALNLGKGTLRLRSKSGEIRVLNTAMSCPSCDESFEELDPRLFSFNSPHGWCRSCRGFGWISPAIDVAPRRDDVSALEAELEEERRSSSRRSKSDEPVKRELCKACDGSRLNSQARAVQLQGLTPQDIHACTASEAEQLVGKLHFSGNEAVIARDILMEIRQRLKFMREVGLGYLQLNRSADTLSGGEAQRIRLASQLGSNLRGVLYVLDEPTIGLHPRDNLKLLDTLAALRDKGNSLLVVEHDDDTMKRADTIIDLGPGAGRFGGELVAQGPLPKLLKNKASVTGQGLRSPLAHPTKGSRRPLPDPAASSKSKPRKTAKTTKSASKKAEPEVVLPTWLEITGAAANNLRSIDVRIPVGRLTVITGVSGSGKSTLLHGVLLPAAKEALARKRATTKKRGEARTWKTASGFDAIMAVHEVDQSPIGKTSRSCPATYVGVMDDIRKLFAQVPTARARGYGPGRFSFNTEGGRCETCSGNGEVKVEMNFLPTTRVHCEVCDGMRFNQATLEIDYNGRNIGEVLKMSIAEAAEFFAFVPRIARPLNLLAETGVGYLQLGQPSPTLSGGEAQRLKLVTELSVGQGKTATQRMRGLSTTKRNLYLIEEPTIGLHAADVARLIDLLHRLVDEGHTVVVIEHHPDVFAEADYLIDIGPEAGTEGGRIVAKGTPEQVARHKTSHTAPFLKHMLGMT